MSIVLASSKAKYTILVCYQNYFDNSQILVQTTISWIYNYQNLLILVPKNLSKKILIVNATTQSELDKRANNIFLLIQNLAKHLKVNDKSVDWLDLHTEEKLLTTLAWKENDSKILEYQARFKDAELIIFAYETKLGATPALLKNYIDNVLGTSFGYIRDGVFCRGNLADKKIVVLNFDERAGWLAKGVLGNSQGQFWNREIRYYLEFKTIKLLQFWNYRTVGNDQLNKWGKKVDELVLGL